MLCVQPSHLILGTLQEDIDYVLKYIPPRTNYMSYNLTNLFNLRKLRDVDVLELRRLYHEGASRVSLSKRFNISYSSVCHIINRDTWRNI